MYPPILCIQKFWPPRHWRDPERNVGSRTPADSLSTPSRPSARTPRTRVQSPDRQWEHRPRQKAGITALLHWRQSLRRNNHGSHNEGKRLHRNVILQEVLSNPRFS